MIVYIVLEHEERPYDDNYYTYTITTVKMVFLNKEQAEGYKHALEVKEKSHQESLNEYQQMLMINEPRTTYEIIEKEVK